MNTEQHGHVCLSYDKSHGITHAISASVFVQRMRFSTL